ncbi:MAG: DUF1294 domain-containing protein [Sulfuritalea sp.]|nr:DUF1294 domain-containing protein [Sulfuritalea sp.]
MKIHPRPNPAFERECAKARSPSILRWPGALFAQRLFRHKSKKQSFQVSFWATVILNCCATVWLFSPSGSSALHLVPGAW